MPAVLDGCIQSQLLDALPRVTEVVGNAADVTCNSARPTASGCVDSLYVQQRATGHRLPRLFPVMDWAATDMGQVSDASRTRTLG